MEFEKEEYTQIKYRAKMGYGFIFEIKHSSDDPGKWYASLRDYDDNPGALGLFHSLIDAMAKNSGHWP